MSPARRDRPTNSCARCYLMKKKCDKRVPSCSRCTQAGAQCLGIHRSDKTEVPRSAVQYLESRLAPIDNGSLPLGTTAPSNNWEGFQQLRNFVTQTANEAFGSISTSSVLHHENGVHYHARLFYSSERPPLKIPVKGVYIEIPPRMASRGAVFRPSQLGARTIPFKVATKLFDNYIKNVLPRYPCFLEAELLREFNTFYSSDGVDESGASRTTCFVVSMILAISSLTSKAQYFRKVASLSESLQRDALSHASFLGETNLRSLQCLTLLIQMALWLPYTANLWYTTGEAMRMAIALGLHQEMMELPDHHVSYISLRRNLFWTVYRLERAIAIASGCPLAISDEHISTQIPSVVEDLGSGRGNRHFADANQILSHIQLSKMQSEIHGIQFFDQPLPRDTPTYSEWMQQIENTIQSWQDNLTANGNVPGWALGAAEQCRLQLYRPCSRNIVPDESCLRAACSVAIRIINGHWAMVRAGSLIFSLQYVFNVFQAGMILLYVLGNCSILELNSALEEEARQALDLLSPLFTALSARWPAATDTGHYVEELKGTVLRDLELEDNLTGRSALDTHLLAELDFMVTQRRIHSVYHRNLETSRTKERIQSELSPWAQADLFTPPSDELWQDLFSTSFEFLADNAFAYNKILQENVAYEHSLNLSTGKLPGLGNEDANLPIDIEVLIRSLPACGYCRTRHVKCDQGFPMCGTCARANRDCVYYDAVLQADVPRSYVHSLYQRYRASPIAASGIMSARNRPHAASVDYSVYLPFCNAGPGGTLFPHETPENSQESYSTDFLFFGASSSFVHLKHALRSNTHVPSTGHDIQTLILLNASSRKTEALNIQMPPRSEAWTLFCLFSRTVNVFYPTVKDQDLHGLLERNYSEEGFSNEHEHDIFHLILAIGSRLMRKSESGLPYAPEMYFHKATHYPDKSRESWLSVDPLFLLQRTLLICIFLLLSPASGEIWRNLGFAIRLYFDLSHRPSEYDNMDEDLICMLFRSLYCLECQASIAFGRPSLLIIGDKLRSNITKPITPTIEDRISSFYYRISLLKMQIHSTLLSKTSKPDPHPMNTTSAQDDHHIHQLELESWLVDWKSEVLPLITNDQPKNAHYLSFLEAWATLHYHHTALLSAQTFSTTSETTLLHCDQIIRASTILTRQQQKSPLLRLRLATPDDDDQSIPVFPMNWTTAHLVFSAGLTLFDKSKQRAFETAERLSIARRGVVVLALLESEVAMLAVGFSEILEGFVGREEEEGRG